MEEGEGRSFLNTCGIQLGLCVKYPSQIALLVFQGCYPVDKVEIAKDNCSEYLRRLSYEEKGRNAHFKKVQTILLQAYSLYTLGYNAFVSVLKW